MSKLRDVLGDAGIVPVIVIVISLIVAGYGYNSTTEINAETLLFTETIKAEINQHKAEADPHLGTKEKLDNITIYMKQDAINNKENHAKINSNHSEVLCKIQQLKDNINKVTETKC